MKRLRVRILARVVGEFSSLQSTLCADSYSVSVTPLVTTVACKRLWPFCQKCRWQVTPKHAYHLDPLQSEWADYAAVQAECGNLSRNELTRSSSGDTKLQLSQLAQLLWTDPGLRVELVCASQSPLKNEEENSAGGDWNVEQFPKILAREEKATNTMYVKVHLVKLLNVVTNALITPAMWQVC